jgi:hypothetical protein
MEELLRFLASKALNHEYRVLRNTLYVKRYTFRMALRSGEKIYSGWECGEGAGKSCAAVDQAHGGADLVCRQKDCQFFFAMPTSLMEGRD